MYKKQNGIVYKRANTIGLVSKVPTNLPTNSPVKNPCFWLAVALVAVAADQRRPSSAMPVASDPATEIRHSATLCDALRQVAAMTVEWPLRPSRAARRRSRGFLSPEPNPGVPGRWSPHPRCWHGVYGDEFYIPSNSDPTCCNWRTLYVCPHRESNQGRLISIGRGTAPLFLPRCQVDCCEPRMNENYFACVSADYGLSSVEPSSRRPAHPFRNCAHVLWPPPPAWWNWPQQPKSTPGFFGLGV